MDINLEAQPIIILCGTSIEAYCNEISSLTKAFLFDLEQNSISTKSKENKINAFGLSYEKLLKVREIKENSRGSFYDRYKKLLKHLELDKPEFIDKIHHLKKLRDSLVHFRNCDIQIVEDDEGVIKFFQKPPDFFAHITEKDNYKIAGYPIVYGGTSDMDTDWPLRVSTNAMAIWAIQLSLKSILHVLESLPSGSYKDFIERAYRHQDNNYPSVFQKGLFEIKKLETKTFN